MGVRDTQSLYAIFPKATEMYVEQQHARVYVRIERHAVSLAGTCWSPKLFFSVAESVGKRNMRYATREELEIISFRVDIRGV